MILAQTEVACVQVSDVLICVCEGCGKREGVWKKSNVSFLSVPFFHSFTFYGTFFSFMPLQIYRLYYGVKRTDLGFIRPFEISNEHPSKV